MSIIEKAINRLDARTSQEAAKEAARQAIAGDAQAPQQAMQDVPHIPAQAAQAQAAHAAHAPQPAPVVPLTPAQHFQQQQQAQQAQPQAHAAPPAPPAAERQNYVVHEINLARLREQGMVTPDAGRTQVAEEFRAIKRPLLAKAFGKGPDKVHHGNLIMVTSALPGEGKTYCALNLALSIAMEMDHTVLLVDADVARPAIVDRLGLEAQSGLLDLVQDDTLPVSDVLMRTNVESLSILPAGASHQRSTELLASQAMRRLLTEIANRYPDRIVIFDSPPLLLTTESRVLAEQMGQIVLVVEAETTTQHAVKNALRQLEGCRNVNLVYNKSKAFLGDKKYGSYYH